MLVSSNILAIVIVNVLPTMLLSGNSGNGWSRYSQSSAAIDSDVYLLKNYLDTVSKIEMKQSVKESLDRIQENVEYINKIVQDLQDYDRSLKLCEKQTDFEELCEEVLLRSYVPETVASSLQVDQNAGVLVSDPDFLKRVLSNLKSNDVQAMRKVGKLHIKA